MNCRKFQDIFVLRLDKGEEMITEVTNFLEENKISLASFTGIGAVNSAVLGFYSLKEKKYYWKKFEGGYEIASLIGNVSLLDNKPLLHAHSVICDRKYKCFGGHLKEAIVGATAEIVLIPIKGRIRRKFNEEIGLNLLDL